MECPCLTVFLRALFGPFRRSVNHLDFTGNIIGSIDWHFFGIREDNSVGFWTLRFDPRGRKFSSFSDPGLPTMEKLREQEQKWTHWVPEHKRLGSLTHPDAFVPDKPMVYGATYVAILRARLTEEDTAFMARVALGVGR